MGFCLIFNPLIYEDTFIYVKSVLGIPSLIFSLSLGVEPGFGLDPLSGVVSGVIFLSTLRKYAYSNVLRILSQKKNNNKKKKNKKKTTKKTKKKQKKKKQQQQQKLPDENF